MTVGPSQSVTKAHRPNHQFVRVIEQLACDRADGRTQIESNWGNTPLQSTASIYWPQVAEIEEFVRFAWIDRVVISVVVREGHLERPVSIILRRARRQEY